MHTVPCRVSKKVGILARWVETCRDGWVKIYEPLLPTFISTPSILLPLLLLLSGAFYREYDSLSIVLYGIVQ